MATSKIPKHANQYALNLAFEIRNKPVEFAKGFNYSSDKITLQSDFIKGKLTSVHYDYNNLPSNIFIHNHPNGTLIGIQDLILAAKNGVKKVIASHKKGYSCFDLTTIKQNKSSGDIIDYLINIDNELKQVKEILIEKVANPQNREQMFFKYKLDKLISFAKETGATFSQVQWSDFRK